jgi:Icc protein
MRLAWATDIHLNFVPVAERCRFYDSVRQQADALVVSGDIAESPNIGRFIHEMGMLVDRPVYFVLGNHDFYNGSIVDTRFHVAHVIRECPNLVYLSQASVVELTPTTALIGHDGWADARLGDFVNSDVVERVNDYRLIRELRQWEDQSTPDRSAIRVALHALGDEAARHLTTVLNEAAAKYDRVIVATHVPPFREATWHDGHPSDDNFLPHFSCKAMGDALLGAARSYPECKMLVLCGHTHGGGAYEMLDNLQILTGPAEYGKPAIQRIVEVE